MIALIRVFAEIALLRAGADALPRSRLVLFAALTLFAIPFGIYFVLPGEANRPAIELSVLVIAGGVLVYAMALRAAGFADRTLQTVTALFGVGALLNLADIFFLFLTPAAGAEPSVFELARLALLVWSLLIDVHILTPALQWPRLAVTVLVLSVFFAQYYIVYQPVAPAA